MDHAAAHKREGIVVGVEGLRHQQLIAIVQDTGHDEFQGLTAAGGGQNVLPLWLSALWTTALTISPAWLQKVTSSSPRTARMLLSLLPLRPTPTSPVPSMMLSWQLSLL